MMERVMEGCVHQGDSDDQRLISKKRPLGPSVPAIPPHVCFPAAPQMSHAADKLFYGQRRMGQERRRWLRGKALKSGVARRG